MIPTSVNPENAITVFVPWGNASQLPAPTAREEIWRAGSSRANLDRALRTVAVLQTTLELEPLIRLFAREAAVTVAHSSMTYYNERHQIEQTVGRVAKHILTYRLVIDKTELGHLAFTRGKPFTEKEAAQLKYLLGSLVYPLRNALQYKHVFDASLTDALTGVYNRAGMEMALRREISLSRRHKTPLSLIILDIDGFKQVNDDYGHEVGDELLKLVADAVSHCLRTSDIVCRYGGDEFTILLSNTGLNGAAVLAQHIREKVENTKMLLESHAINVTVSIGIAFSSDSDTNKDLFARADEALYLAKKNGCNQIQLARQLSS